MTTSANSRAVSRAPGRTPPFLLVGLIVLVGILGYNYWSLLSGNNELTTQLDTLRVQKRELDKKTQEIEKNWEGTQEELRRTQAERDQIKRQLQDKDLELATSKNDFAKEKGETEKLKKDLSQCDEELRVKNDNRKLLEDEKVRLQQELEREKQEPCDFDSCTEHVKHVVQILAKLVGSDAMTKALSEAQLNSGKLMEGIVFQVHANLQPQVNQQLQENQAPAFQQQAENSSLQASILQQQAGNINQAT